MERQHSEIHDLLDALDLLQYHDAFRREGFERLESIVDIQESDFEAMGVKRGHRRLIHRRAMELVNPTRFSRDLPPISSPLLTAHLMHQTSFDHAVSPALEETEPLTAYLYRQAPPTPNVQQPLHRPPAEQGAAASGHSYYTTSPYQYRGYATASQHQQQSGLAYPHRHATPFGKDHADEAPRPTSSSAVQLSRGNVAPARSHPTIHMRPSKSPPVMGSTTGNVPRISTNISQHIDLAQRQHSYTQSGAYATHPASASTDTSSPHRLHNSAIPPHPASNQQPQVLAGRRPLVKQRPRGQSISSLPPVASTSATSRRRGSRADPRSPYMRPAADPQSPQTLPQHVSPQSPRRTYRRHPKKDPNAPEKWRSAYQLFRDDVNQELHGQDIQFSEMSKIHSKRWAELSDDTRNMYFQKSKSDKEEYLQRMLVYERTPEYKQYEEYLDTFYQQDSTVNRVGRPKGAKSSKPKGKSAEYESQRGGYNQTQSPETDDKHSGTMSTTPPSSPSPLMT
ncbi:hypothetical protein J3F81_001123 [Coemansia sp. RSA 371]|nr:hypothetical protein J3F81_001123 [Coemansia sp. RSA 371]